MDRLHELEVFVAVANLGSLAKAGARLRLSPPAVTRALAALEDRLGARVFQRTTRSLSLTEVGTRYLESARLLLSDYEQAAHEAVGELALPQGHLSLSASVTFGRSVLAPLVREFLQAYPKVSASVLLLDRVVNLVEEGIDAALRIGELPDSTLMARRVGAVRRVLVASPAYLAAAMPLTAPADLRTHVVIAFSGLMPNREWRFHTGGRVLPIAVHPQLEINDAVATIAAAEAGEGIAPALSYMVAEALQAGRLVEVLAEFAPPPVPVQLVYPQTRLVAPKLRAFADFAQPRLKRMLEDLALTGRKP